MSEARSVDALTAELAEGRRIKYLFFWGHRPRRDGSAGPGCLSQWWPAPFVLDGWTFATAEHYMMWRKAMLFGDTDAAAEILDVAHPQAVKAVGRRVSGFDQERWEQERYDVVVAGNRAKFAQHKELGAFLLGTGDRVLVEASPLDRVWGIGLAADHPDASDPDRWQGLNLLGFALMEVRAALRERLTAGG